MRRRLGFTLTEIVAVLAIIAVLAAIVIPQALRRISDAHSAALATDLEALAKAIEGFRGNVGRYPDSLTYLSRNPTAGLDVCGAAIPAQLLTQWRGPYINRTIASAGLPVGDVVISGDLIRDPLTNALDNFASLYIRATNVDQSVALTVEAAYDGGTPDLATGTVRWTPTAGTVGRLDFAIPIKGC